MRPVSLFSHDSAISNWTPADRMRLGICTYTLSANDEAAGSGILASNELAMAIGCGFLKAFGGASRSAATKVLLEAPDQVDPHPTVDPDPFQDGV